MIRLFGTALIVFAMMAAALSNPLVLTDRAAEPAAFHAPASPRATYNFNPGWKFIRDDVPDAVKPDFDDTAWMSVSTPHTWNDVDSYRSLISHSGGDRGAFSGIGWYRKHFKLPAGAKDGKVFLEFEGLKQAGRFFVNGQPAGKFENGITARGLDITSLVRFGDADNVLAVKVDNSNDYKEESTGIEYQWMGRAFNPNFGGLNHNVRLHVTGKIYQTLPLYENLQTTGVYVYARNIDLKARTAEINLEAQVRNESGALAAISLAAVVVDAAGVELFVNGQSKGVVKKTLVFIDPMETRENAGNKGDTGFIYAFPNVVFAPGAIKAVAIKGGKVVAQQEIKTAGEPKALKLTAHTGPAGLQADGADVAFLEFEVVDARGNRCPTDEARVDFAVQGPVTWRGGLNSALVNSTNNLYLNTECGINRVSVRSTLTPGAITVTATRAGLTPATVKIESKPVEIIGGLMRALPPTLPGPQGLAK